MAYTYDSGVERAVYSTKKTGRILPNGATEMTEDFDSGFSGHGFKIWKTDDGFYKIEADELMIRKSLTAFELIISQIRAIRGSYAITQGNAKIKHVDTYTEGGKGYYRIEIEDEVNTIFEHDFIRCQKGNKEYHVEVSSVHQGYINVLMSEFTSGSDGVVVNPPEAGDEIVQFGNSSRDAAYANRHSAIYMSVDNGEPKIDLMTNIYTKNWDDTLKVRIGGDLPGTDGERGFFAVNGKLMGVDEAGETVYQINPDGSGFFARGKFSWTADGAPSFSGSIFLRIDNNNVWRVTENGENIIGNEDGKRIVISANNSEIKIYDDDNKNVIRINGSKVNSVEEIFNQSLPTINIKNIPAALPQGEKQTQVNITDSIYVDGNISIDGKFSGGFASSVITTFIVKIIVNTYSDSALQNLTYTDYIYSRVISNTNEYTFNNELFTGFLTKGYNVITLRLAMSTLANHSFSVNTLTITPIINKYISSIFANGISIGTSSKNIFSFINKYINGINSIEGIISDGNNGIRLDANGLQIMRKTNWAMIPSIVCCGRAYSTTSSAYISKQSSFDNRTVTATRIGLGLIRLTFPKEWSDVNNSNCYVMLTGIGQSVGGGATGADAMIKATLSGWTTHNGANAIHVALSDDATGNDGEFYFEIKRY